MYNPYFNPYLQNNNVLPVRSEVVKVNGMAGAQTYQIAPNSSVLLLDEQKPIVYLKTSDGGGYATINAYSISPYKEETPPDFKTLENRIKRLEDLLNESDITSARTEEQSREPYVNAKERQP